MSFCNIINRASQHWKNLLLRLLKSLWRESIPEYCVSLCTELPIGPRHSFDSVLVTSWLEEWDLFLIGAKLSFRQDVSLFINFQIIAPLWDGFLNKQPRALNRGNMLFVNMNISNQICRKITCIFRKVYALLTMSVLIKLSVFKNKNANVD